MTDLDERFHTLKDLFENLEYDIDNVEGYVELDFEQIMGDIEQCKRDLASLNSYKFKSEFEKLIDLFQGKCKASQTSLTSNMSRANLREHYEKLEDKFDETEDELDFGTLADKDLEHLELEVQRFKKKLEGYGVKSDFETLDLNMVSLNLQTVVSMIGSVINYYDNSPNKLDGNYAIYANEAEYIETGKAKTDPDGILYIADNRITFQQKEVVGKTLGLFGGKKKDEILWSFKLDEINDVTSEVTSGMFESKDFFQFVVDNKTYKVRPKAGWSAKVLANVVNSAKKQDWRGVFEAILDKYDLDSEFG